MIDPETTPETVPQTEPANPSRRDFLKTSALTAALFATAGIVPGIARAATPAIEKDTLKLGFIKLTDMARSTSQLEGAARRRHLRDA
jgi:hypothetical protein